MQAYEERPRYKLECASQAEILRSHQRDSDFVNQLQERLFNLLQDYRNNGIISHLVHSKIPINLLYFIFTSGMGNQTLGEEYTGIVQANIKTLKVPSLKARVAAAILECIEEKPLLRLLKTLQMYVTKSNSKLTPKASTFLNVSLSNIGITISLLILIHKGLFYLYGKYYTFGKRLVNINYAKVRGTESINIVSWGLRLLGIVTLVQSILKIKQNNFNEKNNKIYINTKETNLHRTCQLCLTAVPRTATPCGHIFCWTCINDWLHNKPQCPLCREYVAPSRLTHVYNL